MAKALVAIGQHISQQQQVVQAHVHIRDGIVPASVTVTVDNHLKAGKIKCHNQKSESCLFSLEVPIGIIFFYLMFRL